MKIVQITPGAGKMYCGGCFRDNALVSELRKLGHSVTMLPLYLPLTLEDKDQSLDTPVFFGGISVYLEQKLPFFRRAPAWLYRLLSSPALLRRAAGSAAKTNPADVGALTISMLRGEDGNQARELDELIRWLKGNDKPDIVSLSNLLLVGLARKIKTDLDVPVVCSLQGEDSFLDALADEFREQAWITLAERADDIDLFIAPSSYFAGVMQQRLRLPPEKVKVVYNGINLDGYASSGNPTDTRAGAEPVLGFFARMCPEKGLDLLVDTFILLRQQGAVGRARLKVGGSCGPNDQPFVTAQREKLKAAGLDADVEFHPNLSREDKIRFLQSLDVFSVPALYGEAFGLYVLEALAAGVPVVQPKHGAFPEILRSCAGGILTEPTAPALAAAIEELLLNKKRARDLGSAGQRCVRENFSARRMASEIAQLCRQVILARQEPAAAR